MALIREHASPEDLIEAERRFAEAEARNAAPALSAMGA
jgi:hypothetical protein